MRKLLLGAFLLSLTSWPAFAAVKTPAQIESEINSEITQNGVGAITGPVLNGILYDITQSYLTANAPQTWYQLQTFFLNPILPNCTGYLYGNGASPSTCSPLILESGHVLGNPTSANSSPMDTSLIAVMEQSGSGIGAGVATALGYAPNTAGGAVAPSNAQAQDYALVGGATTPIWTAIGNCSTAITYSTSTHLFGCESTVVTSVTITTPSFLTATGCAITSSGTCALGLATQTANYGFWGPASGAAAAPTFRAEVCADEPAGTWCKISSTTVTSQASFQDTTDFAGNLTEYEIVVESFVGSTATAICELQVYSSAYKTTGYLGLSLWDNLSTGGGVTPTTYIDCGNIQGGTTVSPYTYRSLKVRNPSVAMIHAFDYTGWDTISANISKVWGSAEWTGGTTAITGFQVIPSTGSTFSAVVTVYGRK